MNVPTKTNQVIDLSKLFEKTFGTRPFHIPELSKDNPPVDPFKINQKASSSQFTPKGSLIKEDLKGVEILLPVRLYDGPSLLMHLPYVTVNITGKKTIVKTPISERKGTVKEQFNIDDYVINIKGFVISEDRNFPEQQLEQLRALYETQKAVTLDNALTNIFLTDPELSQDEQRRVVINDLNISEVTGGKVHVRPFAMQLESDSIFILELEA
jgi:hypothetical protein